MYCYYLTSLKIVLQDPMSYVVSEALIQREYQRKYTETSGVDRIFEWGGEGEKIPTKFNYERIFFCCWVHSLFVISYTSETFTFATFVNHELCYCIICLHTGP